MTITELWGLSALAGCLGTLVAWLQLQRATTVERRETELRFYACLVMFAVALVAFALDFISPQPLLLLVPSWQELAVSLLFLFNFGLAVGEIRRALRARNQSSPADSDS
jgi:hypothetical protein